MLHLLLGNEYDSEITLRVMARRMCVWASLCAFAGAPSFFVAHALEQFHSGAMLAGALLFVILLTLATCTETFNRMYRGPAFRRAIHITIATRMIVSLIFPAAMLIELPVGLFSVQLVTRMGYESETFQGTLIITLVQGSILLAILLLYMLIVYAMIAPSMALVEPPVSTRCVSCGYDLRGNEAVMTCPECGVRVSQETRALLTHFSGTQERKS